VNICAFGEQCYSSLGIILDLCNTIVDSVNTCKEIKIQLILYQLCRSAKLWIRDVEKSNSVCASDLLMHSNNLVRVVTHEKHWCRLVGVWAFYHRDGLGGFYCDPCFYYVMPKDLGKCMWWQQRYVFYQKSVEPAQIANNQVIHYYTTTKTDLWVVAMLLNLLKPCKIVKWALVRRKSAS
jgi:hypothetical protein